MVPLLLTSAFRCETCDSADNEDLVLFADNRQQLVGFMAQAHLGCKFRGLPRATDQGVEISVHVSPLRHQTPT